MISEWPGDIVGIRTSMFHLQQRTARCTGYVPGRAQPKTSVGEITIPVSDGGARPDARAGSPDRT